MRTYKTEIELNNTASEIFFRTVGVCRFIYNLFIETNKQLYLANKDTNSLTYMNNYEFSRWLNNEYMKNNPDKQWIKEVSSKAIRNAIDNANTAFMKFFKQKYGFPKFKVKRKNDCSFYFVKTDANTKIKHERHRIKIPTLGWCKLKEFGYIPASSIITSGTISYKAGRFYLTVNTKDDRVIRNRAKNDGIGIDLGVKDFAILSDGTKYSTIKYNKLTTTLKREQRKLSRKYKINKNKENLHRNIEKQIIKLQKINHKIANIRNDYQNKVISDIINREPRFITIENLNVSGMMKNRHLSKAIANQGFYAFVQKLQYKCGLNGIELRQVDRFYPSSRICSECGSIKKDLTLKDRVYICPKCGVVIDRDINAAINLKNCQQYKKLA